MKYNKKFIIGSILVVLVGVVILSYLLIFTVRITFKNIIRQDYTNITIDGTYIKNLNSEDDALCIKLILGLE